MRLQHEKLNTKTNFAEMTCAKSKCNKKQPICRDDFKVAAPSVIDFQKCREKKEDNIQIED